MTSPDMRVRNPPKEKQTCKTEFDRAMNSSVLARPNLKMFLLGAIALLLVQHLVSSDQPVDAAVSGNLIVFARELEDPGVNQILKNAARVPNADIYTQISHYYELRRDFRRALIYMRLADLASLQDGQD